MSYDHVWTTRFAEERLHLPAADRSVHLVLFNWVLHHAADAAIPLLREARRVVRRGGRIVVVEDLKGDKKASRSHQANAHPGCEAGCAFRGADEWRELFALLGLTIVSEQTPPRGCLSFYQIPRALYELSSYEPTAAQYGPIIKWSAAAWGVLTLAYLISRICLQRR